jgi:hypothetical protein
MLTEKQRATLIAEQTASFLSDGFGQLDLSGSPSLQPLPDAKFESSDKKGFNNVVVAGSNPLKAFADAPDQETIERIALETGDPDLAERVKDEREGSIAEDFVRSHPLYFKSDYNYSAIRGYLDQHQLAFTSENLNAAFGSLSRTGQLEVRPGHAKALTETELLHIISLTKNGQLEDAVGQYLDYSLPDAGDHWGDTTEFLSDPDTLKVRNQACYFVWFHSRPVQDSPEFKEFARKFFKLKPVHTISDLDDCLVAFERNQKDVFRQNMIREPEPVTAENLNDLSDDAVNKLTQSTLQQRAREMLKQKRGWRA